MIKPAMGEKRVCASCAARFYDLSRDPIRCPKCAAVFVVAPPPARRGSRAAALRRTPVVVAPAAEPEGDAEAANGDVPLLEAEDADEEAADEEALQKDE